jgi:hypothetical protein
MLALFVTGSVIMLGLGLWALAGYILCSILVMLSIVAFGCRRCRYYGRRCDLSLSILATLLFSKGDDEPKWLHFANKSIPWLIVLALAPFVVGIVQLLVRFSLGKLGWLIGYTAIVGLFIATALRISCPHCKMNDVCPIGNCARNKSGSAARHPTLFSSRH